MSILGMSAAAAKLGIHPFTLRRWCESEKIAHVRDSAGRRLFSSDEVERVRRERELQAAA